MMPKVEMWLCTNLLKCQVSSRSKRFMYYQTSPILSISRGGTLLIVTILGASSTSPAPSPACLRFLISASSSALSRSVLTRDISVITHHINNPKLTKSFQPENSNPLPARLILSQFGKSLTRKTSGPTYPGWAVTWPCRGLASSQLSGASANLEVTRIPHKLLKLTVFHRYPGCYLREYLQHLFFCLWQGVEFL